MKLVRFFFVLAALALLAVSASATMTPQYSYYWQTSTYTSGGVNYIAVAEYISGTSNCGGSCPIGVFHYPHAQIQVGTYGGSDFPGPQYLPNAQINWNYTVGIPVSYLSPTPTTNPIGSSIGGWVICTQAGRLSSSGNAAPQWYNAITFSVTTINTSTMAYYCTSQSSPPDWLGLTTNPWGRWPQDITDAHYVEASSVFYTTDNGNTVTMVSRDTAHVKWYNHTINNDGPVPQDCARYKSGILPNWQELP